VVTHQPAANAPPEILRVAQNDKVIFKHNIYRSADHSTDLHNLAKETS
jgi:hypothetical protein